MEPPSTPQNAPQPEAQPVVQDSTEIIDPSHSFTWEASEFVHHEKPAIWYIGLWLAVAIICGILGLLRQWVSIAVVIVMALAVLVYSRKEPRTLQYAVDDHGVSINGKLSPYAHFRSFNLQVEVGWQEIDLEPSQRFAPRLTLLADADNIDQIEAILTNHLPKVDRDPDLIERLSRYLKF
ncbi:MAG TPA: hypothetical protein VMR75_03575 [Candidatus Saccharimonadales bacterium]|nr:hypothetical protein [Candidatus Saccharimonadales bacterium]